MARHSAVSSVSFFMKIICQNCKDDFNVYPSRLKRGQGKFCSRNCYKIDKKGKPSYVRTLEHKLKMSLLKKDSPYNKITSVRFKKLNHNKKGKTWEEIYGVEKATNNRQLFRVMFSGENNPNYKNGLSFSPYASTFTKLLKEKIIARDRFICKGCGVTHQELADKDPFGRGLTVHHIDYDKSNSSEFNLIALCVVCNSKANGKRDYHQKYYSQMI